MHVQLMITRTSSVTSDQHTRAGRMKELSVADPPRKPKQKHDDSDWLIAIGCSHAAHTYTHLLSSGHRSQHRIWRRASQNFIQRYTETVHIRCEAKLRHFDCFRRHPAQKRGKIKEIKNLHSSPILRKPFERSALMIDNECQRLLGKS